ncbi:unnamed protein product [Caenorhabditis angaria]|uniref:Mediator complex subunit 24 n=1 Tax=Caenorhabditis angaria TaxID=860376 RepID=A0A9P1IUE5_9PELO|nr:unnamed protein product [Caenorhabditis angaria]
MLSKEQTVIECVWKSETGDFDPPDLDGCDLEKVSDQLVFAATLTSKFQQRFLDFLHLLATNQLITWCQALKSIKKFDDFQNFNSLIGLSKNLGDIIPQIQSHSFHDTDAIQNFVDTICQTFTWLLEASKIALLETNWNEEDSPPYLHTLSATHKMVHDKFCGKLIGIKENSVDSKLLREIDEIYNENKESGYGDDSEVIGLLFQQIKDKYQMNFITEKFKNLDCNLDLFKMRNPSIRVLTTIFSCFRVLVPVEEIADIYYVYSQLMKISFEDLVFDMTHAILLIRSEEHIDLEFLPKNRRTDYKWYLGVFFYMKMSKIWLMLVKKYEQPKEDIVKAFHRILKMKMTLDIVDLAWRDCSIRSLVSQLMTDHLVDGIDAKGLIETRLSQMKTNPDLDKLIRASELPKSDTDRTPSDYSVLKTAGETVYSLQRPQNLLQEKVMVTLHSMVEAGTAFDAIIANLTIDNKMTDYTHLIANINLKAQSPNINMVDRVQTFDFSFLLLTRISIRWPSVPIKLLVNSTATTTEAETEGIFYQWATRFMKRVRKVKTKTSDEKNEEKNEEEDKKEEENVEIKQEEEKNESEKKKEDEEKEKEIDDKIGGLENKEEETVGEQKNEENMEIGEKKEEKEEKTEEAEKTENLEEKKEEEIKMEEETKPKEEKEEDKIEGIENIESNENEVMKENEETKKEEKNETKKEEKNETEKEKVIEEGEEEKVQETDPPLPFVDKETALKYLAKLKEREPISDNSDNLLDIPPLIHAIPVIGEILLEEFGGKRVDKENSVENIVNILFALQELSCLFICLVQWLDCQKDSGARRSLASAMLQALEKCADDKTTKWVYILDILRQTMIEMSEKNPVYPEVTCTAFSTSRRYCPGILRDEVPDLVKMKSAWYYMQNHGWATPHALRILEQSNNAGEYNLWIHLYMNKTIKMGCGDEMMKCVDMIAAFLILDPFNCLIRMHENLYEFWFSEEASKTNDDRFDPASLMPIIRIMTNVMMLSVWALEQQQKKCGENEEPPAKKSALDEQISTPEMDDPDSPRKWAHLLDGLIDVTINRFRKTLREGVLSPAVCAISHLMNSIAGAPECRAKELLVKRIDPILIFELAYIDPCCVTYEMLQEFCDPQNEQHNREKLRFLCAQRRRNVI